MEGRASQHAHRVPVFEAPRARAQAAACAAALSRVRARAAAGLATLLAAAIFRASSTREAAQSRATSPAATAVTIAAVFSSATATTPSTATATTTPTAAATTTVPLLKHTRSYTPIRVDDHRHRSWPAGSRVAARPPRRRSPPPPPLLLRLPISFSPKPPPPSVTRERRCFSRPPAASLPSPTARHPRPRVAAARVSGAIGGDSRGHGAGLNNCDVPLR